MSWTHRFADFWILGLSAQDQLPWHKLKVFLTTWTNILSCFQFSQLHLTFQSKLTVDQFFLVVIFKCATLWNADI